LFLLNRYYRMRLRTRWHQVRALETSALAVVQEVLVSLRVVKSFGQEERSTSGSGSAPARACALGSSSRSPKAATDLQVGMLTAIGGVVVLLIGVRHTQSGELTLGELLMVMAYLNQIYEPLRTLSKRAVGMQSKMASAERVFALLDAEPDVADRPGARAIGRARGVLEFQDVSFGYDADRMVLHDVSFAVPAAARCRPRRLHRGREVHAHRLLLRLQDPPSGRSCSTAWTSATTSSRTCAGSTRSFFRNPSCSRPRSGRTSRTHDRTPRTTTSCTPRWPRTHTSSSPSCRAVTTHRGRARHAALGRRAPAHHAGACLPPRRAHPGAGRAHQRRGRASEALIMEALERLMRGRTTLTVAHRLSTLERCDLRLELEHGRWCRCRRRAGRRLRGCARKIADVRDRRGADPAPGRVSGA
jgi:ATP-binding cassette subfamily B protein